MFYIVLSILYASLATTTYTLLYLTIPYYTLLLCIFIILPFAALFFLQLSLGISKMEWQSSKTKQLL